MRKLIIFVFVWDVWKQFVAERHVRIFITDTTRERRRKDDSDWGSPFGKNDRHYK